MSRLSAGFHAGEQYIKTDKIYTWNAGHKRNRVLKQKMRRTAPETLSALMQYVDSALDSDYNALVQCNSWRRGQ